MSLNYILAQAIAPNKIPPMAPSSALYTSPKTYGVYEIRTATLKGKRYRFGNHPVRQNELINEFGQISCVALFYERELAAELARRYNAK